MTLRRPLDIFSALPDVSLEVRRRYRGVVAHASTTRRDAGQADQRNYETLHLTYGLVLIQQQGSARLSPLTYYHGRSRAVLQVRSRTITGRGPSPRGCESTERTGT